MNKSVKEQYDWRGQVSKINVTANLKLYSCRTQINDKHIVININVI